jgi:hypothetical protein
MGLEELMPLLKVAAEIGVGVFMAVVVVFVLIYMIRVAIPELNKQHIQQLEAMEKRHRDDSHETRVDFKEQLGVVIGHCQRESAMHNDLIKREVTENTAAIVDLRRTLEELREAGFRFRATGRPHGEGGGGGKPS